MEFHQIDKTKQNIKTRKNKHQIFPLTMYVLFLIYFFIKQKLNFNFNVRNPNNTNREENKENYLFFVFSQGAYKSSTICYSPEKGTWTELEGEVAEPLAGPACSTVILPACLPFNKWQLILPTGSEGEEQQSDWEDHQ